MKNFRFLFVALMSVVCILGVSSCDKDDDGLNGTKWVGTWQDDSRNNETATGTVTYSFSATTCTKTTTTTAPSGSWSNTSTWYYDETNYPTVVLTFISGGSCDTTRVLYISGGSFTLDQFSDGYYTRTFDITFYKK